MQETGIRPYHLCMFNSRACCTATKAEEETVQQKKTQVQLEKL